MLSQVSSYVSMQTLIGYEINNSVIEILISKVNNINVITSYIKTTNINHLAKQSIECTDEAYDVCVLVGRIIMICPDIMQSMLPAV